MNPDLCEPTAIVQQPVAQTLGQGTLQQMAHIFKVPGLEIHAVQGTLWPDPPTAKGPWAILVYISLLRGRSDSVPVRDMSRLRSVNCRPAFHRIDQFIEDLNCRDARS
jgi:hypothetical protein